MAGMLTGALVVIFWHKVAPDSGIYEMIPGFILSSVSIVIGSLVSKAPETEVVESYENATVQYKSSY